MCSWPLILGVFPLHQIAHIGVSKQAHKRYSAIKLFSLHDAAVARDSTDKTFHLTVTFSRRLILSVMSEFLTGAGT